jgi:DNA-directed RNA polymerase specialized sigma24 family protein
MSTQLKDITYRHVAIMLASALPIEGEEFRERVGANLEAIKALPAEQKTALKMAYIFGRKVPREERGDVFQDIALALFKAHTRDDKLAYAIARCDWRDWWKKYKIRQHYSHDTIVEDEEGNPKQLSELIIGEVDFERKIDGKIDAETLWRKLDEFPAIKHLVKQRLLGQTLTHMQSETLTRWAGKYGTTLLLS